MEIRVDSAELFRSVSRLQSIIERKSNMPILSTILFSATGSNLLISATDLELSFQETLAAEVLEEGSTTISGRKLFEILKETRSDKLYLKEKENNRIHISDEITRFDLACIAADEFPALVEPEGMPTIQMDGAILSEMVNKTIYAVTLEEAGFKLSGVFTERLTHDGEDLLRMVATDGHRLSMIDKPIFGLDSLNMEKGVMIPKKGMSELNKLASQGGTVEIGFGQKTCVARRENMLLVMRLLEAKFPDYNAIIPARESKPMVIARSSLLEAMRKMLILSNERYRAVKITLENNVLDLISTNPDLGEAQEQIKIEYNGERVEAGFNPKYFIETLQAMESDVIGLEFSDSKKPCIIRGDADKGFLGLIMPMRV